MRKVQRIFLILIEAFPEKRYTVIENRNIYGGIRHEPLKNLPQTHDTR